MIIPNLQESKAEFNCNSVQLISLTRGGKPRYQEEEE